MCPEARVMTNKWAGREKTAAGATRIRQVSSVSARSSAAPAQVRGLNHVHLVDVACGDYHTLFLTNAGIVFSCGQGSLGRLGQGLGACDADVALRATPR